MDAGNQRAGARLAPNFALSKNYGLVPHLDVESLGKTLVLLGLGLTLIGLLVWWFGPRLGNSGGLLPGDISLRRGSFSFHFPVVTCILVSVLLTVLLRLFNR